MAEGARDTVRPVADMDLELEELLTQAEQYEREALPYLRAASPLLMRAADLRRAAKRKLGEDDES